MFIRALRRLERSFVYFPELTLRGTPEHVGLEFEELWPVTADGVRLHAWHIPGRSDETWVYFHGNGGNMSVRLDQFRDIHRRLGAGIVAFDYRGYGLSGGVPSEPGLHLDALAVLDAVRNRVRDRIGRLIYFGRSMGGAVATRLAVEHPPDALILEAPPPSIQSVARLHVSWSRLLPLRLIMQARFATARHIRQVRAPVLVMSGDCDDLVPMNYCRQVFDAANEPREFFQICGGGHDRADTVDPDAYYAAITSFLARCTGAAQMPAVEAAD